MNTTSTPTTVRLGTTEFGRPFFDSHLRPMVQVFETDDAYVTSAVSSEVHAAWAEVDLFGRQLTGSDI